jgi:hypothetical protein
MKYLKQFKYHHKIIVFVGVLSIIGCIGTNICMLFMNSPNKPEQPYQPSTKDAVMSNVTLEEELINTRKQQTHNTEPVMGNYKPIIKTSLESASL